MKKFTYLACALAIGLFASCQNDPAPQGDETILPGSETYMDITINMPQGNAPTRAYTGQYAGADRVSTLDVYLLSSDGQTMLYSHRYTRDAGEYAYDGQKITLQRPFATTAGDKRLMVIVNSPLPLMEIPPASDYTYALSSALELSDLAQTSTDPALTETIPDYIYNPHYADIITMSGRSAGAFTIEDNVTETDVSQGDKNHVAVDLTRIASRVAVTTAEGMSTTLVNEQDVTLGEISDINWSVAQGENKVYLFAQYEGGTTNPVTSGYSYVPGTDYASTAPNYYDYSDLSNTTTPVPTTPGADFVQYLPGKFLLENTHASAATQAASGYRQGNTAYALVRVKFTPAQSAIADGGALAADGTFYVGGVDGEIYSTMDAALLGSSGQDVYTYTGGKMLYYLWLNPDSVTDPVNSPVVRNSIYHVNILSFKNLGTNWNPLDPSTDNPDPKPNDPNEPDSPFDPSFPLSPTDTYMTVDATVLPWETYSYEIDL